MQRLQRSSRVSDSAIAKFESRYEDTLEKNILADGCSTASQLKDAVRKLSGNWQNELLVRLLNRAFMYVWPCICLVKHLHSYQ